MVKKLQVLVREVYEQEEVEKTWSHIETGETISDYAYSNDDGTIKKDYTRKEVKTGKMELLQAEDNDPVYGQVFDEMDLDVKDLILHLNRTK